MTSTKYIGMDVHKESISIAVRNDAGKLVMECVIETKANIILDFIHGLRGELQVTFEEGTWATWLYDLLKPHVTKLVVCDPRKNSRQGNKNDRIDARELADRLYMNKLSSVYHGQAGVRTLRELARSYLTISKDLARVRGLGSQGHATEDGPPDLSKEDCHHRIDRMEERSELRRQISEITNSLSVSDRVHSISGYFLWRWLSGSHQDQSHSQRRIAFG